MGERRRFTSIPNLKRRHASFPRKKAHSLLTLLKRALFRACAHVRASELLQDPYGCKYASVTTDGTVWVASVTADGTVVRDYGRP